MDSTGSSNTSSLPIDVSKDGELSIKGLNTSRLAIALEQWQAQGVQNTRDGGDFVSGDAGDADDDSNSNPAIYPILTAIYLRTHYQSLRKSHRPHSSAPAAARKPAAAYIPAVISLLQPRPYRLIAWLARHKIRKASEDGGVKDRLEVCQLLPVLLEEVLD